MLKFVMISLTFQPNSIDQVHVNDRVVVDDVHGPVPGVSEEHGHRHVEPPYILVVKILRLGVSWVYILPVPYEKVKSIVLL